MLHLNLARNELRGRTSSDTPALCLGCSRHACRRAACRCVAAPIYASPTRACALCTCGFAYGRRKCRSVVQHEQLVDSGVSLLGGADVRRGHVRLDQSCVQALLPVLLPPCPLEPPHTQRFWSRLVRRGRLHRFGGVLTGCGHLTDDPRDSHYYYARNAHLIHFVRRLSRLLAVLAHDRNAAALPMEHRKKFEHRIQSEPYASGAAEQRWMRKHATTCARAKPLHSEPLAH